MLQEGANHTETADVRPQLRAAADWVWTFLAPGIGPGGGLVMVGDDVLKPSQALHDVEGSPLLAPYQRLVAQQRRLGDSAATAGLLAAGIVRAALDEKRIPGILDGIVLARRQGKALLGALAEPADLETCLSAVDPELGPLTSQLPDVASGRVLDLDRIEVRCDDVVEPRWAPGIHVEPKRPPHHEAGPVQLAIVSRCLAPLPAGLTTRNPAAAARAEEQRIDEARNTIRDLGVNLLVCLKDAPEDLLGRLHTDGVAVVTDCPKSTAKRLEAMTNATQALQLNGLSADDIGTGRLESNKRPWAVHGDGPSATLTMPATGPAARLAEERAEAWLRCVEPLQRDGRLVPGGGAWQRHVSKRLRDVADHAPGHGPVGIRIVATVLERVADAIVRNTGGDPTRTPALHWMDSVPHALAAFDAALSAATSILRVDAAWRKRSSRPADLRGGLGRSGSPKGMPGDIPPLM